MKIKTIMKTYDISEVKNGEQFKASPTHTDVWTMIHDNLLVACKEGEPLYQFQAGTLVYMEREPKERDLSWEETNNLPNYWLQKGEIC
jgi:hypothetical protein